MASPQPQLAETKSSVAVAGKLPRVRLWVLAVGYFSCYVPYAALTKGLSSGEWPGLERVPSGFEMLPATVVGTVAGMLLITTLMRWWPYLERRRVGGLELPLPRKWALLSGLATGVIIGTTTLAYTIKGASIVFMLLMMRGGVLLLAPLVDLLCGRRVKWFSWTGLVLSLLAVGVSLAGQSSRELNMLAVLDVSAYLCGYFCRLQIMSAYAKSTQHHDNLRYFIEEHLVASPVLLLMLGLFAFLGQGPELAALQRGFTHFFFTWAVVPALAIGLLYEALYMFGTWIYLHPEENTLSVPVNRASSLLAGVAASYLLVFLAGASPPSSSQLTSVSMILVAIAVWSAPIFLERQARRVAALPRRLLLFVCSGNTCRSPMAEACGWAELVARLGVPHERREHSPVQVLSAGLAAKVGQPMTPEAVWALGELGIPVIAHQARQLTAEMLEQAEAVYCLTGNLVAGVIQLNPAAAAKVLVLDAEGDIPDPLGSAREVYLRTVKHIHRVVRQRFDELGLHAVART